MKQRKFRPMPIPLVLKIPFGECSLPYPYFVKTAIYSSVRKDGNPFLAFMLITLTIEHHYFKLMSFSLKNSTISSAL